MKVKIRSKLMASVVLCSLLFASIGVLADTSVDDLESQKSEVQDKISETQDDLDGVKEEKAATMEDLDALEAQIATLEAEITQLNADLVQAQADLELQEKELKALEEKLAESQASMQERVKSIYINGDISYLEVIFNASSIDEFLSNFVFFEKIVEQDKGTIATIEENKRLANEKMEELQATKSKIEGLKSNKEAQETEYAAQEQEKNEMVAALQEDEASLEQMISEFQQESSSIESEIKALYAQQEAAKNESNSSSSDGSDSSDDSGSSYTSPTYTGNGQFGWPLSVRGTISSPYGYRGSEFHTGVDLAAPYGTPVLAAESGTVILVKYLTTSYGHYVVIDHGGSYTTLYAHMSTINVSVGDTVSRGQQIGAVGSTGRSTGNHLHFEVRINGSHTNPLSYIS